MFWATLFYVIKDSSLGTAKDVAKNEGNVIEQMEKHDKKCIQSQLMEPGFGNDEQGIDNEVQGFK